MHFIDRPIYIDEYIFRGEGSAMTDTSGNGAELLLPRKTNLICILLNYLRI